MQRLFPALALIVLAACGQGEGDAPPGGASIGERRALDQAAAMLAQKRLPPSAPSGASPPQRERPAPMPIPVARPSA